MCILTTQKVLRERHERTSLQIYKESSEKLKILRKSGHEHIRRFLQIGVLYEYSTFIFKFKIF